MVQPSKDLGSRSGFRAVPVLALLSLLGCGVAAWLYWGVTPGVVQTVGKLRTGSAHAQNLSDALVSDRIAVSLAGGDYGEVQEVLARHQGSGLFSSAVVINASNKIVAEVGGQEGVRIGDPASSSVLRTGRKIDISLDSRKLGELLILAPGAAPVESSGDVVVGLRIGAIVVAALALLFAGAIPWFWWQARKQGDAVRAPAAETLEADRSTVLPAEASPPAPNRGRAPAQEPPPGLRLAVESLKKKREDRPAEAAPLAPDGAGAGYGEIDASRLASIVYANYLSRNGEKEEAIKQLESVQDAGIDNPILQYHMGLAYFEAGCFEKALEFAHYAYHNGIALQGLRNKLVQAGKWFEPSAASGAN